MDKRKRNLLKRAKDEIELDRINKQKQGKVISLLEVFAFAFPQYHFNDITRCEIIFYAEYVINKNNEAFVISFVIFKFINLQIYW